MIRTYGLSVLFNKDLKPMHRPEALGEAETPYLLALSATIPTLAEYEDAPHSVYEDGDGNIVTVGETHAVLLTVEGDEIVKSLEGLENVDESALACIWSNASSEDYPVLVTVVSDELMNETLRKVGYAYVIVEGRYIGDEDSVDSVVIIGKSGDTGQLRELADKLIEKHSESAVFCDDEVWMISEGGDESLGHFTPRVLMQACAMMHGEPRGTFMFECIADEANYTGSSAAELPIEEMESLVVKAVSALRGSKLARTAIRDFMEAKESEDSVRMNSIVRSLSEVTVGASDNLLPRLDVKDAFEGCDCTAVDEEIVRKIEEAFWITSEQAQEIARLTSQPESGREAAETMKQLDTMLEGFGVEAIREAGAWTDNYSMDVVATYVNTGDSHSPTIVHNSGTGVYEVTTWGSWNEKHVNEFDESESAGDGSANRLLTEADDGSNAGSQSSQVDEAKKAKAIFGIDGDMNYVTNIPGISRPATFGERITAEKWMKSHPTKETHIYAKGIPTLRAMRRWIKEHPGVYFWAGWKGDSKWHKHDSFAIRYVPAAANEVEETDTADAVWLHVNEGNASPHGEPMFGNDTWVRVEEDWTHVKYHFTDSVSFNPKLVALRSGGYMTNTTKKRMNQASKEYDLGFSVLQENHEWFVEFRGERFAFEDGMTLYRSGSAVMASVLDKPANILERDPALREAVKEGSSEYYVMRHVLPALRTKLLGEMKKVNGAKLRGRGGIDKKNGVIEFIVDVSKKGVTETVPLRVSVSGSYMTADDDQYNVKMVGPSVSFTHDAHGKLIGDVAKDATKIAEDFRDVLIDSIDAMNEAADEAFDLRSKGHAHLRILKPRELKTKATAKKVVKKMASQVHRWNTSSGMRTGIEGLSIAQLNDPDRKTGLTKKGTTLLKSIVHGYIANVLNMGVNIATQSVEKLTSDDWIKIANSIRGESKFKKNIGSIDEAGAVDTVTVPTDTLSQVVKIAKALGISEGVEVVTRGNETILSLTEFDAQRLRSQLNG